jgi:hypothetical protein
MKSNFLKINLLTAFVLLALAACKKDEIPPIGEPASKLEGINDTWKLSKVEQYDEKVANSAVKYFDITEFFITGEAPVITFNSGAKTYAYDPKSAPNFLGASGTWAFDDDLYPALITATDAATSEVATWKLSGPTRPVDTKLRIAVKRGCVDDASYFYVFTFDRQ